MSKKKQRSIQSITIGSPVAGYDLCRIGSIFGRALIRDRQGQKYLYLYLIPTSAPTERYIGKLSNGVLSSLSKKLSQK